VGGGTNYFVEGTQVSQSVYESFERNRSRPSQAFALKSGPASPSVTSTTGNKKANALLTDSLNCTAYITYPILYEGVGLKYQGDCPSGYAEGQQTISADHDGVNIQVSSFFRSGTISGQTTIRIRTGIGFKGTANSDGSVTGQVIFSNSRFEEGTFVRGRIFDGIVIQNSPTSEMLYYRSGRNVSQSVYQASIRTKQAATVTRTTKSPSYSHTPPAQVAQPPTSRQSAQIEARRAKPSTTRPRSLGEGECIITPPPELVEATTTTEGQCEGNQFTGKVTFTLAADTAQSLETKYIVPFKRGRPSGPMSATFPSINGVFKGSFNGISPDNGFIEIPLGNNVYEIAELRGGNWVSQRTERREPGFMEQLVGAIITQYVIPAVQQRIRQEVIKGLDELRNRPERHARYARIKAEEARQREAQQEQERQNAERLRLANEERERQEAARQQAENERQAREATRVAQQAEADRLFAERQAQSQRDYAAKQAEAAERERQRQIAEQEKEADRQRQMAQNTFGGSTSPPTPEFGGSTGTPVVTTSPPDQGVPPPLPPPTTPSPPVNAPELPPPLPSGTPQPDPRPTYSEPPPLPAPTELPAPTPLPSPPPSWQSNQPEPSPPPLAPPVQAPTRSDTIWGGSTSSQPTLTYSDVMTPSELALSARLPVSLRAESQYSPEQIRQIKQDGRWQNWVNDANAYLAPAPRQAVTPSTPQSQPASGTTTPQLVGLTPNDRRWVSSLVRELQGQIYSLTPVQIDAMRASGRWDELKQVFTQANGEILAANEAGAREQIAIWEKAWSDTQTTIGNGIDLLNPFSKLKTTANALRAVGRNTSVVTGTRRAIVAAANTLPEALRTGTNARTGIDVYIAIERGQAVYCGITCDITKRTIQHAANGRGFDFLEKITRSSVTKGEARAIEEALIRRNPTFYNKRHEISPEHDYYQDALRWGEAWLVRNGL
jgi:flagellar biosynthesis GTPase FlhF